MAVVPSKDTMERLRSSGVPFAESSYVDDLATVGSAAIALGFPVVLKAAGINHKTDDGGVVLDLFSAETVLAAAVEIIERLGASAYPLLVQRQYAGMEILLGIRRQGTEGAVLIVGAGGVTAELLDDTAVSLVPLDEQNAERLLRRLRCFPLLDGYRGAPARDTAALVDLMVKLSRFASDNPGITELDLNPVLVAEKGRGVVVVDARLVVGPISSKVVRSSGDLSRMLEPRHVVVVGVSDNPAKTGSRIYQNIVRQGFEGQLDLVHPAGGSVDGRTRFTSLSDVPGSPDLVLVAVPASEVLSVVKVAAERRVGGVVVHSSGFAESSVAGLRSQEELALVLSSAGVPLAGPNCMGIVCPPQRLAASLSGALSVPIVAGSVALVSGSGALGSCVAARLMARDTGLSRWLHLGNEASLTAADYLRWLAYDDETTVVGMLIEHIPDGQDFVAAARQLLSAGKPLFVFNMVRTPAGQAAVASHTGALVGSNRVRIAVLEAAGATIASDLTALEDSLVLASRVGLPAGPRLAAMTASGGACTIIADEAEELGIDLSPLTAVMENEISACLPGFAAVRNPIDVTAEIIGDPSRFEMVLRSLADERVYDALFVQFTTNADPGAEQIARGIVACRAEIKIPIYVARYGSRNIAPRAHAIYEEAQIPVLDAPDRAMRAVGLLVEASCRLQGMDV